MAPIRRYLRITKYSVLECRIYLDNPALAESWLLNPRDPILPRVIESVRPHVLPKLREENEQSKAKGKKKKSVRDVVVEDDFEISIFLTETTTRHSLLTKHKHLRDSNKKRLQSNSQKLTGGTNDTPIEVEDGLMNMGEGSEDGGLTRTGSEDDALIRREGSEDDVLNLQDLPEAQDSVSDSDSLFVGEDETPRRLKRGRASNQAPLESDGFEPLPKRRKDKDLIPVEDDDKKKMAMDTSYEGFAIYGRVLCLVVKRKDKKGKGSATNGGQAMMENWITSTQMPALEDDG